MKTEWHRYNLKRRVTQLPPVDEDTFRRKVDAVEETAPSEQGADTGKFSKRKSDKKAKREHLREQREALLKGVEGMSLKHSNPNASSKDNDIDSLIEAKMKQRVEIKPTTCLFCSENKHADFNTVDENILHMSKVHGLFIPEKKYLVDKKGLIVYLGEKLGLGNVCISCTYQGKDLAAVREHMRSKRHIRIPYESDEEKFEISDFYDFTSSYDIFSNDQSDEEDWEDVPENEEDDAAVSDVLDEEFIINLGDELVLPNGLSVGHRTSRRSRRQKPDQILSEGQGTVVAAECRQFNQLGATVTKGQQVSWKSEKRMHDLNDRRLAKYANNQPYYRDQLLQ